MNARRLAALALVSAIGCSVYEPPGGKIEVTDSCDPDAPALESVEGTVVLDGLANDISSLSSCNASGLTGPDGFAKLVVAAGERWHLEARPPPGVDAAMYLMESDSCDARGVDCRLFVDRCPAGVEEELTIVSPTARTFHVGFDTHGAGDDLDVFVSRTRCGDAVEEHGEVCDDGNIADGDGCDASCRAEILEDAAPEIEPNDWHSEANVLRPTSGGSVEITGQVGGLCDQDHFAVFVEAGETLSVEAMSPDGTACEQTTASTMIMVMDPYAGTVMGMQGGTCPAVVTTLGSAGEYHVMYMAASIGVDVPQTAYRLRVSRAP